MTQCAISARALVMLHVAVSTMLAHDVRGKLEQKQFTKVSVMHAELLLVVVRSDCYVPFKGKIDAADVVIGNIEYRV